MKNTVRAFGTMVAVALLSSSVYSQDTLVWFNDATQNGPDGTTAVIGTPDNALVGGLVQLIRSVDGVRDVPSLSDGTTTGIAGDDMILANSMNWFGKGGTGDGIFADFNTFANLSALQQTDQIYVRIWDRPSADGNGLQPFNQTYAGQTLVNYPAAVGMTGKFYMDGPLQAANAEAQGGGFFNYTFPTTSFNPSTDWNFIGQAVPIPEPSTIAFGLLAVGALFVRRRKS